MCKHITYNRIHFIYRLILSLRFVFTIFIYFFIHSSNEIKSFIHSCIIFEIEMWLLLHLFIYLMIKMTLIPLETFNINLYIAV